MASSLYYSIIFGYKIISFSVVFGWDLRFIGFNNIFTFINVYIESGRWCRNWWVTVETSNRSWLLSYWLLVLYLSEQTQLFGTQRTGSLIENLFIFHFKRIDLWNYINALPELLFLFIVLHKHLYLLTELISVMDDVGSELTILNGLCAILQVLLLTVYVVFQKLFAALS